MLGNVSEPFRTFLMCFSEGFRKVWSNLLVINRDSNVFNMIIENPTKNPPLLEGGINYYYPMRYISISSNEYNIINQMIAIILR